MSYSIFEGTMADMCYLEVEAAAAQNTRILFPIAVIEEHGPHMPLGVDTYLTYTLCQKVKAALEAKGCQSLIAPPFYWGINHANGGFPGSFTVRKTTMIAMLVDILVCMSNWGFKEIYLLNVHGDYYHNKAILEGAQEARLNHGIDVYVFLPDSLAEACKVNGIEEHVLLYKMFDFNKHEGYIDLHAGAMETAWMINNYPDLVNIEETKTLESSKITEKEFMVWARGGLKAREVIPNGYCGDPAKYDVEKARDFEDKFIQELSEIIIAKRYKKES